MSIISHRDGIASVLTTLTAPTTAGKFAVGFKYPRRNFADKTLTWPFWTLQSSACPPDRFSTAGEHGENEETVITRLQCYGQHVDGLATYDAFLTLFGTVLTEFRKDSNIRLSQEANAEPCLDNSIMTHQVTFPQSKTAQLILGTIDFQGKYIVFR